VDDDWPWSEKDADELNHLWNGSDPNWVVFKLADDRMIPYNKQGHAMLIEASGLNALICQRMIDAGCEVWTDFPHQEVGVEQ
jgi:hypothetical protein